MNTGRNRFLPRRGRMFIDPRATPLPPRSKERNSSGVVKF
jgi:hypothetical protein